ncbi:MAG: hypothetical protein KatS3mg105_2635 [Gemmatales bacterium]|nr:MAG: hypothetical protein KatS3mg105_2635 [Gemmatales bacterium]
MLIGYVSDEYFVALPDVLIELEDGKASWETRSRASGAIYAEVPPGEYRVTLHKSGFGAKSVRTVITPDRPSQFRLLSDCLLGYAWPKWVKAGEFSEFRVHSPEAYKLELWHYSWKKQLVEPLGWFDEHGPRAVLQITPDGDYTQTGVQWNKHGYYSKVHQQRVRAPNKSGLYYFHAKTASGRFFSFPWIVAPARPKHKLAVLVSNINWNAYNNFGGRSNYIHPDALPSKPVVNARLECKRYTDPDHIVYDCDDYAPLSFDRPEPMNCIAETERISDPISGRNACHLAPAEWRLLGWLAHQGFAHDVYAETQLHDGTLDLDSYQALVLGPHPEYWSKRMYDSVKSWVMERGGKLVYLGGNGLNCEVEFLDSHTMTVRNGDMRELRQKKAESRFHLRHESEANLLGVVFTESGAMTAAPYRVIQPDHWVFAGTGLKKGRIFGERSLHERCPGGASGHETDKISPSSPRNVELLAKGLNPDDGGADMVYFETPSKGAVFSVGSICWVSSLIVDDHVSRITTNVLKRFLKK